MKRIAFVGTVGAAAEHLRQHRQVDVPGGAHQFAGMADVLRLDLIDRCFDICRTRIGHGLYGDGSTIANRHIPNVNAKRFSRSASRSSA